MKIERKVGLGSMISSGSDFKFSVDDVLPYDESGVGDKRLEDSESASSLACFRRLRRTVGHV